MTRKSPVNRGSSRLVLALRTVIFGPSVYRKTATFRPGRRCWRPDAFFSVISGTVAERATGTRPRALRNQASRSSRRARAASCLRQLQMSRATLSTTREPNRSSRIGSSRMSAEALPHGTLPLHGADHDEEARRRPRR